MRKTLLMILDGWGIAVDPSVSAIDQANVPFYRHCLATYPHSKLQASEEAVGLPRRQFGNSEVGHMHLGAGRVIYQELVRITRDLNSGAFAELPAYKALLAELRQGKRLHLIGLLSDGGVHSHTNHIEGVISQLAKDGIKDNVFVHIITDGRDTGPKTGLKFARELESYLRQKGVGRVATVCGRYYAMDRDKRWERVKKAYDLLVHSVGTGFDGGPAGIKASYDAEVTDEFIEPIVVLREAKPIAKIQSGDAVLFYNYRTDRGRELTMALTQQAFPEQGMTPLELYFCTMTEYDSTFKNVHVLFQKDDITHTMGEVVSAAGLKQIRIAETEKYPHVTFFFNGGREEPFEGEQRIMIPSPKVATYDLQPEMSAQGITDAIVPELKKAEAAFVCLNFANPDMVGHTGVMEAAIKACETVDACAKAVSEAAHAAGYDVLILADHGNADIMRNPDGTPHTAHTTALVPCIYIAADAAEKLTVADGTLADIAPTLLTRMGLKLPTEMTGKVLVQPA
jgi:2,3-bisphosphoglycerate-independent phosphoglycerate mutase